MCFGTVIEKMWGESSSPIFWSVQIMIEGKKSPPRPGLIKQDWNLIDFGLFESGYKISWADKTRGMLSTVAETLDSFLLLSQHPSVPRASYRYALWCRQLVRQLVSMLASIPRPRTPSYYGLSSSPVSQSRLSSPDSWQLMHLYSCLFKSFI